MKQVNRSRVRRECAWGGVLLVSVFGASNAFGQAPAPAAAPATPASASAPANVTPFTGEATGAPTATTAASVTPVDASLAQQPSSNVASAPVAIQQTQPVVTATGDKRLREPRVIASPISAPEPPPSEPPKTRYPFALFLDISPLWQTSRAYDLFSKHDVSIRTGLTAEADLFELAKQTWLSVDLGGSFENASDTVLGSLETEFNTVNLAAGLRLRRDFWPVFGAHVVALGGASRVQTSFDEGNESKQWVPTAQLGAGVTGMLPGATKVRPGLLVEGGYFLSGAADLTLKSAVVEDSLTRETTNLGTLERSGAYLRFSVFARY
jgi:hypothetical protein